MAGEVEEERGDTLPPQRLRYHPIVRTVLTAVPAVRENDDRRTPVGYGEQKLAYESRPLRVLERDAESGWRAFGDRNSGCDARDHCRYFLVGELGEVGV